MGPSVGPHNPMARQTPQDSPRPTPSLLVVQIGPADHIRGGMTMVRQFIATSQWTDVQLQTLDSYVDERRQYRNLQALLQTRRAMTKIVRTQPAVLFHIHFAMKGSFLRKAHLIRHAHRLGAPVLAHSHGSQIMPWYESLPAAGKRWVRRSLDRASGIIVLSAAWKRFYEQEIGCKAPVTVIPNAAIASPVPRTSTPGVVRFIAMGRLGKRKGTFELVSALAQIANDKTLPKLELVLLGDGAVDEVRAHAVSLGVESLIRFPTGWVSEEEKQEQLSASDVFILPSHNEGLPVAMLEAMATGIPPIVTPVGGIGDVIQDGENGLLVAPGDVPAIAAAMRRLALEPKTRKRLGIAAKEAARPFDPASVRLALHSLYTQSIAGAP